jgi:hypothetical protein
MQLTHPPSFLNTSTWQSETQNYPRCTKYFGDPHQTLATAGIQLLDKEF